MTTSDDNAEQIGRRIDEVENNDRRDLRDRLAAKIVSDFLAWLPEHWQLGAGDRLDPLAIHDYGRAVMTAEYHVLDPYIRWEPGTDIADPQHVELILLAALRRVGWPDSKSEPGVLIRPSVPEVEA